MQNNFIIVIPVYNAENYIDKCIGSVLMQDYRDYSVIVIDDHSIDNTWGIISEYNILDNLKCFRNDIHTGSPVGNLKQGIEKCSLNREDIIVLLDGDDWLSDEGVLTYLNEAYQEETWMTYGQYEPLSKSYKDFSKPIENTRTYRKSEQWHTSAPKTFKRWLWHKIDPEDMKFNGEYARHAADRACLYPMIEMAGKHCKFINKVLYIYNDLSPDNFFKTKPGLSHEAALYFINKPTYKEL